jgi:hypothetical protein
MKRKSFTTTLIYKRDEWLKSGGEGLSGARHLSHVLREKTQRALEKNADGSPLIEVIGDPDIIRNQVKAKQKNQQGYYYEVMSYAHEKKDLEEIKKYLAEKYNRPVLAVSHMDEILTGNKDKAGDKTPHTHFILPHRDDSGRGMRIRQSDFFKDRKAVAAILGQEYTTPGNGRKSISIGEYRALEKEGRLEEKIEELEKEQAEKIQRKNGISPSAEESAIDTNKPALVEPAPNVADTQPTKEAEAGIQHEEKKFTVPIVPSILPAISPIAAPPVKSVKSAAELIEEGKARGVVIAAISAAGAVKKLIESVTPILPVSAPIEQPVTDKPSVTANAVTPVSAEAQADLQAKAENLKKNLTELGGRWVYEAELDGKRVSLNKKPMDKNSSLEELQGWIAWRDKKRAEGWKGKMVEFRKKTQEKATNKFGLTNEQIQKQKEATARLFGKKRKDKNKQPQQPSWLVTNSNKVER